MSNGKFEIGEYIRSPEPERYFLTLAEVVLTGSSWVVVAPIRNASSPLRDLTWSVPYTTIFPSVPFQLT
jgi:hypothetical protein